MIASKRPLPPPRATPGRAASSLQPGPWRLHHTLALSAGFALIGILAVRQVGSPDAGFHLKTGQFILAGRGWPASDPFTYTLGSHAYIDTSWGYQVLLAAIHGFAGAPGLVLFHAALILAAFLVVSRTARLAPSDPASLVVFLLAAGLASEMRFEIRPETLSWLFLVLVLHVLHRDAEGLPSPLWTLPLIHGIWANCHSLFILGWAAQACFLAGGTIRRRRFPTRSAAWGLASIVVTFVNPYGWRGVVFPFTLATRLQSENPFAQTIGEFTSPFHLGLAPDFPFYPRLTILAFRIVAVLAVLAIPLLIRQRRWSCAIVMAPFLVLAVQMIRNLPLAALVCLPGLVWAYPANRILAALRLSESGRRRALAGITAAAALVALILAVRVVHNAYYIADRRLDRFGLGWNRLTIPIDAAGYARNAGLTGRVLNHLNFGGYLMWAREGPVFIDGRLEVVGEEFYRDYQAILGSDERLESAVSRYGIEWIIFPYNIAPNLLGRLSKSARWRLAYVDDLAVIFVRSGPGSERFVDPGLAHETGTEGPTVPFKELPGLGGPSRPRAPGRWIAGLVRPQSFPSSEYNRGLFHLFRGELTQAERLFSLALQQSGGAYYEIYNNLAATLFRERRTAEAAACYRIVLDENPSSQVARERLASPGPAAR